jgi:membrane associated rhomboid family serine protease
LQPDDVGYLFYNSYASLSFGILYLLYSIYGMRAKNDNIGHTAHFGGAIGGYVNPDIKSAFSR